MSYKEEMKGFWDEDNNIKSFDEITTKDTEDAHWICKKRGCKFISTPKRIYHSLFRRKKYGEKTTICTICKEVDFEDTILFHAPEKVKAYWDCERNIQKGYFPQFTEVFSNKMIHVKCDVHGWKEDELYRIADLKDHIPCPSCSGMAATPEYNLGVLFPILAMELHSKHNKYEILPYSSRICDWYCAKCEVNYPMMVSSRTNQNQGCPTCNTKHQTSKTEAIINELLNKYIGGFSKKKFTELRWGNGHGVEIDVFNNELQCAIEYDGYYSHRKEVRKKADQEKMKILRKHPEVKVFIRIRDEGLADLECFEDQYIVKCDGFNNNYLFLVPALMKVLKIIKSIYPINVNLSRKQLQKDLNEIIPTIHNTGCFISVNHATKYPGLARHFVEGITPNPFFISYGSKEGIQATCPNCGHVFPSTPKRLSRTKGKCPKCLFFVTNINEENALLERWYYKVKYEKSLEKNKPQLAVFYSLKNPLRAGEISPNSHYDTFWNCPFCHEEYESTVDRQSKNGCKCTECGSKAIAIEDKNDTYDKKKRGDVGMKNGMVKEDIHQELGYILSEDVEQEGFKTSDFQYEEREH